jgi:Family of unknown function (DUF6459)
VAKRVRTIMATFDDIEQRQRRVDRPRRRPLLPPPGPAVVAVAVTIQEVKAGLRPAQQLDRLSHYSLWPAWPTLAGPPDTDPVSVAPRLRAVRLREVVPGLVDATVVIELAGRAHALGLRLDGAPGFWQLVELDYPVEHSGLDLQAVAEPLRVRTRLDGDTWSPRDLPQGRAHDRQVAIGAPPQPLHRHLARERNPLEAPGIELE